VFERLGQADSAAAYYQRVIESWSGADAEANPFLEDLQTRLARVRRDTHP
jgi:hypothetical protein